MHNASGGSPRARGALFEKTAPLDSLQKLLIVYGNMVQDE